MSKRSKVLIAAVIAALLIIIAVLLVLLLRPTARRNNGVPLLHFEQGDVLAGYPVLDEAGQSLDIRDIPGARKLLLFALDTCGDCKAAYDSYRLLFAAYDQPDFNVAFIWDDRIPAGDMQALGIAPGNAYTADGRYKFTDWVPTAMVVDAEGTILLKTADMGTLAAWLATEARPSPEALARFLDGRSLLLGIDRCAGCKAAREALRIAGTAHVYAVQGDAAQREDGVLYDPHSLLSTALHVDAYPALVSVEDGALHILGPDDLKGGA